LVDEKGRLEWTDGDDYCKDCNIQIVGQKVITKDRWFIFVRKSYTQCITCYMLENGRKKKKKITPREEGYDEEYKINK
jgi:hypothetical protein